jgi:predicted nucleic acid-binding protein
VIVVDTTAWIDFLEARGTLFDLHLRDLILQGASLALTDIIYCEVLQGIVEDARFRRTRAILRAYPILRVRGLKTFEHAADIYRACRKTGLTIRKIVDCLIAATCLEAGTELYHNDRDFEAIARVKGLRIYRPSKALRNLRWRADGAITPSRKPPGHPPGLSSRGGLRSNWA